MPNKNPQPKTPSTIFITVLDGVAVVDATTIPDGVTVEIVDLDALTEYPEMFLSEKARAYIRKHQLRDL